MEHWSWVQAMFNPTFEDFEQSSRQIKSYFKLSCILVELLEAESRESFANTLRDQVNQVATLFFSNINLVQLQNDENKVGLFIKLLHQIVMSQSVTTKILRETQDNISKWANFYWKVAFDQTPGEISDVLFNLYLNDETKLSSKAEDIFDQAIDFFSNLLIEMEQAGINFDNPGEVLDSSEAIDEFIRQNVFTQD